MSKQCNINTEQEIAKNIVSLLDSSAQNLSLDHVAKLDSARQRALDTHLRLRTAPAYSISGMPHSFFDYFDKHRRLTSSGLAFGVILAAFLVVQPFSKYSNNEHSDAFLLGSELPPEAYTDKGFDKWVGLGS